MPTPVGNWSTSLPMEGSASHRIPLEIQGIELPRVWVDQNLRRRRDFGNNQARIGLIAVNCPEMIGYYPDLADPRNEYLRKVRTVLRGISAIPRHPWVLNPLRMGMFSFEVWSHKIMRWGVPWFMLLFLVVTLLLQGQGTLYTIALIAQILFYAIALLGWKFEKFRVYAPVRIILFFVQSNIAIADATMQYLTGKRVVVWTPSKR